MAFPKTHPSQTTNGIIMRYIVIPAIDGLKIYAGISEIEFGEIIIGSISTYKPNAMVPNINPKAQNFFIPVANAKSKEPMKIKNI